MSILLTDDELKNTVDTYEILQRNQSATAEALGIARSTLQNRLEAATSRGIGVNIASGPLSGQSLTGTSTLYKFDGENGKPKLQWVKTKVVSGEITLAAIKEAFESFATTPIAKLRSVDDIRKHSLLSTVYPIADLHFGMYAWKEETGADYDTAIAKKVLTDAYTELLSRGQRSDTGIVLNLGDYFHADNDEQKTRRSGNKLDVDTRYARVLREGVQLLINIVELAKQKHKYVLVKNIPGNHDPYGSLALTTALAARYASDKNVIVDTDASAIWQYHMGKTLITAAHGDMIRPQDMPSVIAARYPDVWGASDWRYAYLGHIHRRRLWKSKPDADEFGGMEVEVFRTVAPKDSWSASKGFVSRRSLVSITHHYEFGEIERQTVNIK